MLFLEFAFKLISQVHLRTSKKLEVPLILKLACPVPLSWFIYSTNSLSVVISGWRPLNGLRVTLRTRDEFSVNGRQMYTQTRFLIYTLCERMPFMDRRVGGCDEPRLHALCNTDPNVNTRRTS